MGKQKQETKTPKGEQTRTLILNAALDLLADRGYEKTTMRAIAEKAGVSLGNAYHYFKSKEHLIQAFYHRTHEEHLAASVPIFEKESSLKGRSEEHTSELQSLAYLVCRLLLEKKKKQEYNIECQ